MSDKTTELREKLMERGVKYRTTEVHGMPVTFFDSNGLKASVTDHPDGYMIANIVCPTPEQAVAATLGSDAEEESKCCLMYDGKKYPAELDFGFLGMMPITITVGGFRYLVEVSNGE